MAQRAGGYLDRHHLERHKRCADCGPQSVLNFYDNSRSGDGLSTYCKVCHKRRATEYQKLRREGRAPVSQRLFAEKVLDNGYTDRHEKRRAEEAANCIEESSPVGEGGVCSLSPESEFIEPESSFANLMNGWMRQPQTKTFGWR